MGHYWTCSPAVHVMPGTNQIHPLSWHQAATAQIASPGFSFATKLRSTTINFQSRHSCSIHYGELAQRRLSRLECFRLWKPWHGFLSELQELWLLCYAAASRPQIQRRASHRFAIHPSKSATRRAQHILAAVDIALPPI